jgi:hypothetical protein
MAVRKQRAPELSPRGCHFKGTGAHSASDPRSEAGLEWRGTPGKQPMLLELLRPLSFFAGMLSLYPVMLSAFFVPGTRWEDRFYAALLRVAVSACICERSALHPSGRPPDALETRGCRGAAQHPSGSPLLLRHRRHGTAVCLVMVAGRLLRPSHPRSRLLPPLKAGRRPPIDHPVMTAG